MWACVVGLQTEINPFPPQVVLSHQQKSSGLWELEYRLDSVWVLAVKPGPFARAASAFKPTHFCSFQESICVSVSYVSV